MFIEMAGVEKCAANYHIIRACAGCNVLAYVAQGEGSICDRGKVIPAKMGDVFILEKHQPHDYWVNSKKPWYILWFNIRGELFLSMLSQYRLNQRVYKNVGETVQTLFENALLPGVTGGLSEERQCELELAVIRIIMELYQKQINSPDSHPETFSRINSYLESHANPPQIGHFSLEEMAESLDISVRQLTRIYRKETGITPYEYILKRKAELAGQYLISTMLNIKEITHLLGFSDPYYFSNFFKKRFGASPKAYRAQYRNAFFTEN